MRWSTTEGNPAEKDIVNLINREKPAQNHCARRDSVLRCRHFEQGAEWGGAEPREAFTDAGYLPFWA